MKVAEIWRYPVKTMAGEKLQRARLGPLGIEGDRIVHVEDAHGRVITSRSHPRFLGHQGTLGPDGEPLVGVLDMNDAVAFDAKRPEAYPLQLLTGHGLDRISPDLCQLHGHLRIAGLRTRMLLMAICAPLNNRPRKLLHK